MWEYSVLVSLDSQTIIGNKTKMTQKKTTKNDMDIKKIQKLADLLIEKGLGEIHVEDEKISVKIVAGGHGGQPIISAPQPIAAPVASTTVAVASAPSETNTNKTNGKTVNAPIVGTAYLSPEPGAKTFVNVGQEVKIGQVIMIIEAMKNMNEIHSTENGTIKEICVDDGQPVEYGETLIIVE